MILVNTTTCIFPMISVLQRSSSTTPARSMLGTGVCDDSRWLICGALPNDWSPIPDNWRFS